MSLLIAHACLWLILFIALYLLKFESWMLLIFKSSFAGKRIPRTESGLVGGNCAGCNKHKAHKRKWSWSDQELEKSGSTKMRSTGAVEAWTGAAKMAYADFSHF